MGEGGAVGSDDLLVGIAGGGDKLGREFFAGELAGAAVQRDLAGLGFLAFHVAATGELRDGDGLQVGGPVLQPSRRRKRPDQPVIRQDSGARFDVK